MSDIHAAIDGDGADRELCMTGTYTFYSCAHKLACISMSCTAECLQSGPDWIAQIFFGYESSIGVHLVMSHQLAYAGSALHGVTARAITTSPKDES